ncbi:MAG: PAS domain S-box protein [Gammaproteobacteria bacterium]|nr:PAS domain S-box protein [Gammaproteobacteria bacterium]
MFIELIKSVALLLALSLLQSLVLRRWPKGEALGQFLSGCIYGFIAVIAMMTPVELQPGLIFDPRSVIISLAGFFGGPFVALISAMVAGGYRLWLGGVGAFAGILVIVVCAAMGIGYRYLNRRYGITTQAWHFLFFGFVVHVVVILCMLTLPPEIRWSVIANMTLPILLIFPPATLFLGFFLLDIENRLQLGNALLASEARFRSIFQSSGVGMIVAVDEKGEIISWNTGAERAFGYSASEAVGQPLAMLIPERYREMHNRGFGLAVGQGSPMCSDVIHELSGLRKSGEEFPLELSLGSWKKGGKLFFSAIMHDTTRRKQVEESIRESEKKYRSLIEFTNVVHWKVEVATEKFSYISPQIEKLLGYPVKTWTDINSWITRIHPDDREEAVQYRKEKIVAGDSYAVEYRAIGADGGIVWVRDTVSVVMGEQGPRELVGFMQDITLFKEDAKEKWRLQRELQQAQKMEALGQLTGGIAHDFNNILGIILGYTEFSLEHSVKTGQPELVEYLKYVETAGERAKKLVAQMMAFSRGEARDDRPLQLQSRVKEDLKMLRSTLPASIEIQTEIEEKLPYVLMDPTQLNQILMNLCVNARDAMEGKGSLTIRLGWARGVDTECNSCHKQLEGDWVDLSVTDTGTGISPEVLKRVFDPFYTTKGVGRGTGMGLSVIHGIMRNHDGHVLVETEPGRGTTFRLLFPPVVAEAIEISEAEQFAVIPSQGQGERILVVDDEPDLGEFIGDLLEAHGYRATVLANSKQALELLREKPREFSLVITDQTMAGVTGVELVKALRRFRTDIPVILNTGFSEDIDAEGAARMGIHYLEKPVRAKSMIRAVGKMLRQK